MRFIYVILFAIFMSVNLFAQNAELPSGSGTADDPYQIASLDNLYWIADRVNNENTPFTGYHFLQISDIDASSTIDWFDGEGWNPIGNTMTRFRGSYNGQGYVIDGLFTNIEGFSYIGLFGFADGGRFQNIGLTNVNITGLNRVGGLIGRNENTTIINCYTSGNVNGNERIGGLIGHSNNSRIINSHSSAVVTGATSSVGGFIGHLTGSLTKVIHSHSTGSAAGTTYVGGFAGAAQQGITITDSYSHASATGTSYVGGFAGILDASWIYRSFSTGLVEGTGSYTGGFIGRNIYSHIYFSFWDTITSAQTDSSGGIGRTTSEMYQQSTYTHYNFVSLWEINEGVDYPVIMNILEYPMPADIDLEDLDGSGLAQDPYIITSAEELHAVRKGLDSHFRLSNSIDLAETVAWNDCMGWLPIGTSTEPFTGSFDGNGFTLSNLIINRLLNSHQGLFGVTKNAELHDLHFIDANIQAGNHCGALVGTTTSESLVEHCSFHGFILSHGDTVGGLIGSNEHSVVNYSHSEGLVIGISNVGGLIGSNENSTVRYCSADVLVTADMSNAGGLIGINYESLIEYCDSEGIVEGHDISAGGLVGRNASSSIIAASNSSATVNGNIYVGGLAGTNISNSSVVLCYSTGDLTGYNSVGGLVGYNSFHSSITNSHSFSHIIEASNWIGGFVGNNSEHSIIQDCFSTGSVNGNSIVGGFVGWNRSESVISNCYSIGNVTGEMTVGGFVGYTTNAVTTNSYWNTETSGYTESDGGEGRTTNQMTYPHDADTYTEWDFEAVWIADSGQTENNGYPYLREIELSSEEDQQIVTVKPVLLRNYPNPFNPETTIFFSLPQDQIGERVRIEIFNIRGQKVHTLFDDYTNQKDNHILWTGRDDTGRRVASGVYLYRLVTSKETVTNKMMLLK